MIIDQDQRLRHLVESLGADFKTLANSMGLSYREFMFWWNQPGAKRISDHSIENLAAYLGTEPQNLLAKPYPIEHWREKLICGPSFIEEKYFIEAHSKVRTSAHIIKYLSMRFGRRTVDQWLREMGVHPAIYANHDNQISLEFFIDLLERAKDFGLTAAQIHGLAAYLFLTIRSTPLGELFAKCKNHYEVYQTLDQNKTKFETNFIYSIDAQADHFFMIAKPQEFLMRWMIDRKMNLETLIFYRRRVMGWFPYLAGLPPIAVELKKSIIWGHSHCEFLGKYPK